MYIEEFLVNIQRLDFCIGQLHEQKKVLEDEIVRHKTYIFKLENIG